VQVLNPRDSPSEKRTVEHGLTLFLNAILQVLADVTPQAEPNVVAVFRSTIEQARARLAAQLPPDEITALAMTCVDACEHYLEHSRHYHASREAELLDLIGYLRGAAKALIGGSSDFNAQVLATSHRLGGLDTVTDLRELKRRISNEVSALKHATEARQKADQEVAAQLARRIESLESSLVKVEHEAATDPLTKIANRGMFDRTLPRLMNEARRLGKPLCLAIFDLDTFKQINDTLGHVVGDRVLLFTAQTLTRGVRETDLVARHGGDEFVIVLVGANVTQAANRLETLVTQISDHEYQYSKEPEIKALRFTVSCGVAEMKPDDSPLSLTARADEALLEAKRKGRNRVQSVKTRGGILSRIFTG
jgi:diguanylate cyclase (GGDEF)-like protein